MLFQSGQLLSAVGSSLSTIAYPLLVLALTHSPVKAGLVSFARLLPASVLALPAGVVSDRFDRRRIMLASDAVRALALGGACRGRVAARRVLADPAARVRRRSR